MIRRFDAKNYYDPEKMAADYLADRFKDKKIEFPINPFLLLKEEGVVFRFLDLNKLEGVYLPADPDNEMAMVGINNVRAASGRSEVPGSNSPLLAA